MVYPINRMPRKAHLLKEGLTDVHPTHVTGIKSRRPNRFLDESANDFIVLQLLLCVNHFVALESGRRFRFI